jgi:hypothetical protein
MNAAISNPGEPREERESQGGGSHQLLLSGGDEHSEPESLNSTPPAASESHQDVEGAGAEQRRSRARRRPSLSICNNCTRGEEGRG